MTKIIPEEARKAFENAIKNDGIALAAARLCCSTTQVLNLSTGKRAPGLRLALAIEEIYLIPIRSWIAEPICRKI